tara:strand:- start:30063 stop:30764 length:702 start_codon:yes stop_codon:yes gene_type:complete
MTNVAEMTSRLSTQGIARDNRWLCRIYPPPGLTNTNKTLSNLISRGPLRVNVNLPGLDALDAAAGQLNNVLDTANSVIGTDLQLPTLGAVLTNMNGTLSALNLFCANAQIPGRDIFSTEYRDYGEPRQIGIRHQHGDLTLTYYSSEDLRERSFFENWQDLIFNPKFKQHAYYKEYAGRMEISKYNQSWSREMAEYRFNEVYPTNVGVQELQSAEGDLLRLNMTFKYYNYERLK